MDWIPLITSVIAAASVISVAVWNSRGDSGELRRLKAMNEALKDMPSGPKATAQLSEARDALAIKIATRYTAPTRSWWSWGVAWPVIVGVLLIAMATILIPPLADLVVLLLSTPAADPEFDLWLRIATSAFAAVASGLLIASLGTFLLRKNAERQATLARERTELALAAAELVNNAEDMERTARMRAAGLDEAEIQAARETLR